ncbi:MAG: hypothetical protein LBM67_08390 [Lentimicrobiaceae bacterium]|jgi:hypothetical protein|nr:hypothetical protein [Lentimicrobiaceae bacterium]
MEQNLQQELWQLAEEKLKEKGITADVTKTFVYNYLTKNGTHYSFGVSAIYDNWCAFGSGKTMNEAIAALLKSCAEKEFSENYDRENLKW